MQGTGGIGGGVPGGLPVQPAAQAPAQGPAARIDWSGFRQSVHDGIDTVGEKALPIAQDLTKAGTDLSVDGSVLGAKGVVAMKTGNPVIRGIANSSIDAGSAVAKTAKNAGIDYSFQKGGDVSQRGSHYATDKAVDASQQSADKSVEKWDSSWG